MNKLTLAGGLVLMLCSCSWEPETSGSRSAAEEDQRNLLTKQDYLEYFESIKGKGCISGQFIRWHHNASLEEIQTAYDSSGRWIGMLGADYYGNFQDSFPAPGCQYALTNKTIDNYYNENGLVNLSVHFINPQTGGSAWDAAIDLDSLFIAESRVQKNFLRELDSVAVGLEELQHSGVMVMFRPFHEMNGDWFWWGKRKRFTQLWQFTHRYLAEEKGLGNMLWCWSPDAGPGNIHAYYPGDEYVDMVGLDSYGDDLPGKALDDYHEILRYNKPFGFSEYGCVQGFQPAEAAKFNYSIMLEWLKSDFPQAIYFLVWRDHWGFTGKNGVDTLLNDPLIINREEVMSLKLR